MEIDFSVILQSATAGAAFVACYLSFQAIQQSEKISNRQILVGKIEEAYEITQFLRYYYSSLEFIFDNLSDSRNEKDTIQAQALGKNHQDLVDEFKKNVDVDELEKKIGRLRVLAQAYLKGELKMKVLVYCDLFEKLIVVSLRKQIFIQDLFYNTGFPKHIKVYNYCEELEVELLNLIDLGEIPISQDKIADYRADVFLPRVMS